MLENDPQAKFSSSILVNFTRPENCRPLLLGPLAKSAGGWESCGPVFADTSDPAYQQLLHPFAAAKPRPMSGRVTARPASARIASTFAN